MNDNRQENSFGGATPDENDLISSKVKESLEAYTSDVKKEVPGMHTFATDIARTAQDQKMSVIKIALAEQKRREEFKHDQKKVKHINLFFVLLSCMFVIGGVLLAVFFLTKEIEEVPLQDSLDPTPGSLIFVESQQILNSESLTRPEIINELKTFFQNAPALSITNLIFISGSGGNRRRVDVADYLNVVAPNINTEILQYFDPLFMYGISNEISPQGFMIVATSDMQNLLGSLRVWEKFMLEDVAPILNLPTKDLPATIFAKDFQSEFVFNKEARVVRSSNGDFVFGYLLLDPSTIMFGGDEKAIKKVIERFENQSIR